MKLQTHLNFIGAQLFYMVYSILMALFMLKSTLAIFLLNSLVMNTAIAASLPRNPTSESVVSVSNGSVITPFELSHRAYQGRYSSQGVNGFASLKQQTRWGRITADTIVEAAITMGDLPLRIRSDRQYLSDVEWRLWSFTRH